MKRMEFVCLQCPIACVIQIELDEKGEIVSLKGEECKRGKEFAEEEVKEPARILTTTVNISSADREHPLLPVKSASPIPKRVIREAMVKLADVKESVPVQIGGIVMENILGTGVDIVATAERLV